MIDSWQGKSDYEFPFYFVQIAAFNYDTPERGVLIRDAQRRTLKTSNTAMVVVSDICTVDDIHPATALIKDDKVVLYNRKVTAG